jgi:DNA-binding NarL/FixJ family response regulator
MTTNFINYILLAIGILTVMTLVIMIFLDKLKGDDLYFNIDVKEQEIKKVIDDAEEILSELNFTSDVIVKEIEEKINNLNTIYRSVNNSIAQLNTRSITEPQVPELVTQTESNGPIEKTTVPVKFKPMTMTAPNKNTANEEKSKSKRQLVFEMAEQGTSIVDIAKRMNMGQGEVSLILSLKNEEKQNDKI